jgi:hypothetical protein
MAGDSAARTALSHHLCIGVVVPGFTRDRCFCGGTLEPSDVTINASGKMLDTVPALRCNTCGSVAYHCWVLERVEAIVWDGPGDPGLIRMATRARANA